MDGLGWLDGLPAETARAELLRCCGSSRWVAAMLERRPFTDEAALLDAADRAWASLSSEDWLEAFRRHPRIGDREALRVRFGTTRAWATGEQNGVEGAADAVLEALVEGNRAYEARFGHIFIICATGKSAEEMLASLRSRLANDPSIELGIAAGEQARITRLRLTKLLAEHGEGT